MTMEHLEERLRHELQAKLTFVERTSARPTEEQVQRELEHYGNECHDTMKKVDMAQDHFIKTMTNKEDTLKERAGGYRLYLDITLLIAGHEKLKAKIITKDNILHEGAEEVRRLDYRNNVNERIESLLVRSAEALLEEEKAAKEEAAQYTRWSNLQHDKTIVEIYKTIVDLRGICVTLWREVKELRKTGNNQDCQTKKLMERLDDNANKHETAEDPLPDNADALETLSLEVFELRKEKDPHDRDLRTTTTDTKMTIDENHKKVMAAIEALKERVTRIEEDGRRADVLNQAHRQA
ncbi:unnamed protein product [Heligmosomoides polygyrus]|uniref:DUF4200 domain-containing protein n=1 Tax=Heligmosomoides polygyrus TaxID=6339 RepID=A0A183FNH9_HELPZ|nr:unnamed protein product [Heligmosomoides polygyrus]